MTLQQAIRDALVHPTPLLVLAALLVAGCLILIVLLVRAVRALRTTRRVPPVVRTTEDMTTRALAVIDDAQATLQQTERALETDRERLERLRLEAAIRRRAAGDAGGKGGA